MLKHMGCSLGEPEMDQDVIDEDLEDLQKDLEALEQQLPRWFR